MPDKTYYIRVRGMVSGPFDREGIQKMIRLGTFSRANEISLDQQDWHVAMHLDEFFGTHEAMQLQLTEVEESSPVPLDLDSQPPQQEENIFSTKLQRLSLTEGICTAVVLVFCSFVPYARCQGRLLWWWNSNGVVMLTAVFALAAAVVLIFVAALFKGLVRGWVYIAIGGVGILLLSLTTAFGLGSVGDDGGFLLVRIAVALVAGCSLTALLIFGLLEILKYRPYNGVKNEYGTSSE